MFRRFGFPLVSLCALFVVIFLFALANGMAYQEDGPPVELPGAPLDDGGTPEVGVEWITDWPGTDDDRANWYYSANNLYNELGGAGWLKRFNYGNGLAWEKDFKHASEGGINDYVIDSVDLAMIGTHGSSAYDSRYAKSLSSVYFSTYHDDLHLSPGEAYRAYGNNDLEWLAFDSCSVLRDDSMWYWYQTFDGLHLMLGFANTMYVVYPGDGGVWGDQMQTKGWWIFGHGAKTVTQAWFTAVEDQQPSGVRARVLAEALDSYNDYIWGEGYVSPDYPNNGYYWYWDHVAGTPAPRQIEGLPTQLPAVEVVPREVTDAYVMGIGRAFGLTSEVLTSPDGKFKYMVGGADDQLQLRVDTMSGAYFYEDLGELWTDPQRPRELPGSEREALALATAFLEQNANNLPGAQGYDREITPTVALEGPVDGLQEKQVAFTQVMTTTDYAVHFARSIDVGGQKLTIVGPGSRQNVYIGDQNSIIGLKGGWRDVQTTSNLVNITTAEEAWDAFLADNTFAVAQVPMADLYDRTGKPAPTLAYYEQTSLLGQVELIPVWVFVADLYMEDVAPAPPGPGSPAGMTLLASDAYIYLPAEAAADTLPDAVILSPEPDATIGLGQAVDLSGSASGGTGPYEYLWTSNVDGVLGSGPTVAGVILHADVRGSELLPNVVTLQVTDANGLQATATVEVNVPAPLYLPFFAH